MKTYFCRKIAERKGLAESVEFLGFFAVILALFYVLMLAFPPLMVKADVISFTKTLVRHIEVHGAIDAETEIYAEGLADAFNLDPVITYDAEFIEGTNQIQIRDTFLVTVTQEETIPILSGGIFEPVEFTVSLGDRKLGISETLWK